jgi:hypothetical protein
MFKSFQREGWLGISMDVQREGVTLEKEKPGPAQEPQGISSWFR